MKKLKYDTLLILGPQGSGKTTQLLELLTVVDAFSASVGQIIRDTIIGSEKEEHKAAYQDMVSGKLIDDSITHGLLVKSLERMREQGEVQPLLIFDGFPRSVGQAHTVLSLGEAYHGRTPKVAVIHMDMDIDAATHRCLTRAERNRLEGKPVRADDTHEAIGQRLSYFFDNKKHVYGLLETMADIHTFDAHKSKEEIHSDILEKLFE